MPTTIVTRHIIGYILLIGGVLTAVYFFESELFPSVEDSISGNGVPQYGFSAVKVVVALAVSVLGLKLVRTRPKPGDDSS